MTVRELYSMLENKYPRELSAPWDNDGLMCCSDPGAEVKKVLLSLDATKEAIEYAAKGGFDVLLTHHPMIFRGVRSFVGGEFPADRVLGALYGKVTVISLHTRLDAADGGVNDALAASMGFDPASLEKFGDAECPTLGRIATMAEETDVDALAALVKNVLGAPSVRVTGRGKVRRIALVGGSGKDLTGPAAAAGADVLVTGESGYNVAEDAAESSFCTVEAGHYHTEAPVLDFLDLFIRTAAPEITTEKFDSCAYRTI